MKASGEAQSALQAALRTQNSRRLWRACHKHNPQLVGIWTALHLADPTIFLVPAEVLAASWPLCTERPGQESFAHWRNRIAGLLDPMDDPSAEAGANRLRDSEPVPTE